MDEKGKNKGLHNAYILYDKKVLNWIAQQKNEGFLLVNLKKLALN